MSTVHPNDPTLPPDQPGSPQPVEPQPRPEDEPEPEPEPEEERPQ